MSQADRTKINHAFWESEDSCIVVLTSDCSSEAPPIQLKSAGLDIGAPERLYQASIDSYFSYRRDGQNYVFTMSPDHYPWLSETRPGVYLAASFNGWDKVIGNPEWELLPEDSKDGSGQYRLSVSVDKVPEAELSQFKFVTEKQAWLEVPENTLNAVHSSDGITNFVFNPQQTGQHCFRFRLSKGCVAHGNERIVWSDGNYEESYDLANLERLLSAKTDLPLGAMVERGRTRFRLFAPRAHEVQLGYGFESDRSDETFVALHCIDGVTWEAVVSKNLSGAYYSFRVAGENKDKTTNFDPSFAILDPYAKACLGNFGPGIVVDPKRLKNVKKPFTPPPIQDLVILEGHVRDLAVKAPIELTTEEREGFSGLRKWIQCEGSYLREIGVNAIELQPIQQIGDVVNTGYHWGYMTANYFSPASNYALEPENASQIEEFRDLVQTVHDEGIALIMDVVYNHIGEPYHLGYMDTYYFLSLDENHERTNWSGCGNDLRCDTPMARRLIIESLKHFIEVYDVDGFRFDLAELIGVDVLREIEIELKKVKPSIILIAEPWSFRGRIQHELSETGYAAWNDGFRESIAGYVCGNGTAEMIQHYLSGSPDNNRWAARTINYTESHDDHCWIDRITEQPDRNGSSPTWIDQRRTHLMASILFVSLGVPMLAKGQDFMRSKLGVANTYQRGDLNALNYERRLLYSGTHAYFCSWIGFRLSESGKALRYQGPLKDGYLKFFSAEGSSAVVAIFNADRSLKAPKLIYAINPHTESIAISCDTREFKDALQIADHERFDVNGLSSALFEIAEDSIRLPQLSTGLWILTAADQ